MLIIGICQQSNNMEIDGRNLFCPQTIDLLKANSHRIRTEGLSLLTNDENSIEEATSWAKGHGYSYTISKTNDETIITFS